MKNYDITIIGAGSIGTPLAFYLGRSGLKVAVIEKHSSVGQGQNKSAIGGVRATHSDPAKILIGQKTINILNRMEEEFGFQVDWMTGGYLFPVFNNYTERALKKLLELQKHFDLQIDWIGPDDVEKLAPGISRKKLLGGTYSPEDGSASPLKVIDAFYQLARYKGVDFYFNEEVQSFQIQNKKITQIQTTKNKYSSGLVINAAGAGAAAIGKLAGLDFPVYPESHEGGITEPVQQFFKPMIVDIRQDNFSANYYFYQNFEGQVVFCITPQPNIPGVDIDCTSDFLPLVTKRMLTLYPRLRNLRIRRTWRGLYPMTPDGFPIVGYTKEITNLMNLIGMCGQGFMLGPGLGEIIAEYIETKNDKYDSIFKQLSLYRDFSGSEKLK